MLLQAICDDVWAFEQDLRISAGFSMPARTTIVRRPDGGLIVHSPLPIDDGTAKAIGRIGEVRALVAPSCIHYAFLKAAIARYPEASVFGAPGLEKKIPGVEFEPLPTSGTVEGLGDLRVRRIEGAPYMTEHVFFHEKTRSLIVTDFMFNIQSCRSFAMKVMLWLGGAWRRPTQSKLWRFKTSDRAAGARSVADVLTWDFDRMVVSHGDIIESAAKQHVLNATTWLLRDAPALLGTGASAT